MDFFLIYEQDVLNFWKKITDKELCTFTWRCPHQRMEILILAHGTLMYEGWVYGPICGTYGPFGFISLSVFISTCQIIFMSMLAVQSPFEMTLTKHK